MLGLALYIVGNQGNSSKLFILPFVVTLPMLDIAVLSMIEALAIAAVVKVCIYVKTIIEMRGILNLSTYRYGVTISMLRSVELNCISSVAPSRRIWGLVLGLGVPHIP